MNNRILLHFLLVSILVSSCAKDDCECPSSDDGNSNDARDQYVGNYAMLDSVTFDGKVFFEDEYTMVVSKTDSDSDSLLFLNIANSGEQAVGILSGSIYILPNQDVTGGLNGEGSFSDETITHEMLTDGGFLSRTGQGSKFE